MGARLLVHESVAEDVIKRFVAKASSIRCGNPQDPTTQMGPVISGPQLRKARDSLYFVSASRLSVPLVSRFVDQHCRAGGTIR